MTYGLAPLLTTTFTGATALRMGCYKLGNFFWKWILFLGLQDIFQTAKKANVLKAVAVFKDEDMLDYINVEQFGERKDDLDERLIE
jgi:hypothetical protein